MKIVIIGVGNTATVLGRKLSAAGHEILQVMGRSGAHAAVLASTLGCSYTCNPAEINPEGEVYLAAVTDSALGHLGETLCLPGKLIVHTAGSVPGHVLRPVSGRYGVFYPLQSLRKEMDTIPEIPILVDGVSEDIRNLLFGLALTITDQVIFASDLVREKLHVAATLANNFTNHLYTLAAQYCQGESIDFALLYPLIKETAGRISHLSPMDVQTGPAVRRDQLTIEKHINLLQGYGYTRELYIQMTENIRQFYGL